jgi:hypothetical protein
MTAKQLLLVGVLMAGLAGAAFVAKEGEDPGLRMVGAAEKFLGSLEAKQKARAAFPFDSEERTRWFFTPKQAGGKTQRKGLALQDMTKEQRERARELLRAGTSKGGYVKATTIMSLESILAELEKKGRIVRDPRWYFFTVFGTPAKTGRWGWRVEGHHLSLNFVVDRGKVVAATPAFFGANPAQLKSGPKKGFRTLPEAEDGARALFAALDAEQLKAAHQKALFSEIEEGKARPKLGPPQGLPGAKMNDKQKKLLWQLIDSYAERMPPDVAARELATVKKTGLDKVFFKLGGDPTPGQRYTYRVQGPTFVIEFLNEQRDSAGNPANHIHSVWRNVKGDFALPE